MRGCAARYFVSVVSGLLLLAVTAGGLYAGGGGDAPGRVLFLSSYHPGFPTLDRQMAGIRSVLDPLSVQLDMEFMDTKRFDSETIIDRFHPFFSYKLSQLPPYDVVLVGDDNALRYALAHEEDLFRNMPVVFFGVNNRRLALDQNENPLVTGVLESVPLADTLSLITRLQPEVRRIVAIADGTVTSQATLDWFYARAREFKSIQFSHLSLATLSFDEMAEVLKTFGEGDAVLLLSAFMDSTGRRVSYLAGIKLVTDNLGAPLYHLWYPGMGKGIIGGKLISHYDQGRSAAEMARDILQGRAVHEIPVVAHSTGRLLVDPRAMKARGLSLSLIPEGVDRFQADPSEAERFRLYSYLAMGIIGALFLGTCVMAVIAFHRRRADEQVARSELRLRRVVRHMEEVFCVGSLESGELHEISPAVEAMIGLSPYQLCRNPRLLTDAVHEEDRERFLTCLSRIHSGREDMETIEFRLRDVKGQVRWIRFRGFGIQDVGSRDVKIAGMATDVTDAKQEDTAMKALMETLAGRAEQDLFDGAVRQLCSFLGCDIAIIGELKDGRMIQTLSMVQDGCMMESMLYHLVGTPCFDAMHDGICIYPEGVLAQFPSNDLLSRVGAEGYLGLPLRSRSGEIIGVMCAISRSRFYVPKRTQEVVAILAKGIANEMERLESERQKRLMEASLMRSQKMEAIGTLAGGIAHDFNNILFPIMGYVQMMQDETTPESPHGRYLQKIHASSLRAKKLVDQILAFGRKSDQVFKPVSVPEVLTEVLELVRASLPSTIDLRVEIAEETLPVMGDATQIHQVVMNLVTNAYHAMEGRGGCIGVRLGSVAGSAAADGRSAETPWLVLAVSDTGCGIDPVVRDCIFDPYFTTKPKEKGTGLGLAVVQGIVENHGGSIAVESTLGSGTTFTVSLPCMARAGRPENTTEKAPLPQGHEHVLVVDDEAEVGLVEQMMLARLGYQVSVAASGQEALAFFSAGSDSVDLVLTDMTMPQMTGLQLVARLREKGFSLPALLCTGLKDAAQERAAEGLGIAGIVKKPVSMSELAVQVRTALDSAA